MTNIELQEQVDAWKAARPFKGWRVFYDREVYDVIARDEAQVHAELATVLTNYKPQLAKVTANV